MSNQGVIFEGQISLEGKKFGKVTAIFFQEWGISSCVVCYDLTTIDGWLKPSLKTLVYKGGGAKSSGFRGTAVVTKTNSCRSVFGCVLVWGGQIVLLMKKLRIRRFTERINFYLMTLVGCACIEVHGVTRNGENHNFGGNFWDTGSV